MSLLDIGILFAALATLALVPSTSVALVVVRASTAGFAQGAAVAAGIVAGDLLFVCLAVFGMAALAETLGGMFLILRYLAAAYLIWFGISLVRRQPSLQVRLNQRSAAGLSASFLSGLFLTLGDLKAIFFYASLFPAFVDLASLQTSDMAIILAVTVVGVGGVKLGYAWCATAVASRATHSKIERAAKLTAGGCMIGAGTYLFIKT